MTRAGLSEDERAILRDWWEDAPNMSEGTMLNELDTVVAQLLGNLRERAEGAEERAGEWSRKNYDAQHRAFDLAAQVARVEALLPACYVFQSDDITCRNLIGGKIGNGPGIFTEEMACLPCILRAALSSAQPDTERGGRS